MPIADSTETRRLISHVVNRQSEAYLSMARHAVPSCLVLLNICRSDSY